MGLTAADVEQAHRGIGHVDELVGQRRLLYRTVIEMLAGVDRAAATTDDVLDSPAVRGHIGAVLGGSTVIRSDRLLPTTALVADGCAIDIHGYSLRIATSDVARVELAEAVRRIEAELGRHGDEECALQILGPEDPRFPEAFRLVTDGGRLVMELVPQLAADLLAHIAVVAVLVSTGTGRLGSASAREYPGVVLLPEPGAPLEVAEAIVHEGAHQKFFDLALTRRVLGAKAHHAPRYVPPWSGSGAPSWPLEQAFAAFHAYCCLDVLARSATARADLVLHPHSLLPYAHMRSMEICGWLRRQGAFLGEDGHTLIAELTGRGPDEPPASEPVDAATLVSTGKSGVVRAMGSRTLVAVRAEPLELAWVLTAGHDTQA